MNVKAILAAKKLGGDIISIEPTADLATAAKLLSKHRIGSVVILGAGERLVGILSERDIVRAVSEQGAGALALPVGQVMTRDVATCGEDDTVASIMERMTAGRFRHMPVVANGRLVGLISIGDVVKLRVEEIEGESEAMRDIYRALNDAVLGTELLSQSVVTIAVDCGCTLHGCILSDFPYPLRSLCLAGSKL